MTVSPFREDVELARSTETVPYVSEEAFDEDDDETELDCLITERGGGCLALWPAA